MSWMKRPQGGAAPPPGPDQPPYNAPQSYGTQPNTYPNYHGDNPGNSQQQQYWQAPPQQQPQPQYNQQYGQVYQQQEYGTNANQYYQPPTQYNQNYNPGYNTTQQAYQQNYYQNQGQPNYPQNKTNADSWEDNWDWGWEDSSKQAQIAQQIANQNTTQLQAAPPQQVFNNANVIEESFATTDSWNWPVEEKKDGIKLPTAVIPTSMSSEQHAPIQNASSENKAENDAHKEHTPNNITNQQSTEEVKTLNDRDIVKEHLPNLALGKRLHLDNLTPQWSIESQMSQESSDGPHTHSEGTYRSENQSRNSSKGSPGLNTDNSNFNYSQSGVEELYPRNAEWSQQSADEPTLMEHGISHNNIHDSPDELSSSLQEMSINNSENPAPDSLLVNRESDVHNIHENVGVPQQPPPTASPANFPPHPSPSQGPAHSPSPQIVPSPIPSGANIPTPSSGTATLPPPPSSSSVLPPPSSSSLLPPPKSLPPAMPAQNPYKLAGPFSHKNISKSTSSNPPTQQYPSQAPNASLMSPSVVNKVSQHNRMTVGFGANLETTPDNSERPDQPQVTSYRPMPVVSQIPDNLEIAPQNDRNEYLQTAHLSSGDYGENTDFSRNVPPPGLRRMVVGQQESEYTQNLNMGGDEPPPGLSRMVPGQQNEAQSAYNQPNDNYMDRHIDGQPMESGGRPYRQAEGQQTSDNYSQPSVRNSERRPVGLDRMVPGEPSSNDYSQYQTNPFIGSNEQRVVTGEDHEYAVSEPGISEVREQVMDGSEYIDQTIRNPSRSVIGARESSNDTSPDFSSRVEEQQREIVMEGENLQDLSMISSGDLTYSREQIVDGADLTASEPLADRKSEAAPESLEHTISGSRRQSLSHVNTSGEDTSERDRLVKSSPRRDKHKSSREREKEGRYSRSDRKYDRESERRPPRDERRSDRDRRERDRDRERDESPESRRARRGTRDRDRERERRDESPETRRQRRSTRAHRYETEDTDYYSDRDRYQRRQREGSYTSSKPPRHEGSRYREDREYRRYNTIERESARTHRDRDRDRDRDRERNRYGDRYEHKYRDIDPTRKYGNLRKERDEERKRVVTFSSDAKSSDSSRREGEAYSPPRADSRELGTDDERRRRRPHRADYYAGYEPAVLAGAESGGVEGADAYTLQYQYYEHLRRTNPALYLQLYKRLVAAQPHDYRALHMHLAPHYQDGPGTGLEGREERGSLHSGRSSAAGLKGNETDLNTDASLNLHLEESTVRSERMTPFRYSTAHIKGSVSSRHLVVVPAMYPVDGRPARVTVTSLATLLANSPDAIALRRCPGPLVKGVTHKKSVIEYCEERANESTRGRDGQGRALLWTLLALLLRQNGVVVGTDIAELLMKNTREYEYEATPHQPTRTESRRESSVSSGREGENLDAQDTSPTTEHAQTESAPPAEGGVDAVERFRDLLISGNRQEALEWALSESLWGHALVLAWHAGGRARASAAARFVTALPPRDPLHSLYCALASRPPPAATCVSDSTWGDWRPHAAILLANPSARPDHDRRTLLQLGDTLLARGLLYSAQFCYISGGVPFATHPLAPMQPPSSPAPSTIPRLALLLADHKANTFDEFATNEAIFATEIYEYALSLNQDYVIKEFQLYKLVLATRLADVGQLERALAYTEQAARAVTRAPHEYPASLLRALAALADRLKYDDPALQEESLGEEGVDSGEPSPRHRQWVDDVTSAANAITVQQYHQTAPSYTDQPAPEEAPDYGQYYQNQEYGQQPSQQYEHPIQEYGQQSQEYNQQSYEYGQQNQEYSQQSQDYSQQSQEYGQQQGQENGSDQPPQQDGYGYGYEESTGEDAWRAQQDHYGYGEAGVGGGSRPVITMPGSNVGSLGALGDDRPPSADTDRETESPKPGGEKGEGRGKEPPRRGWLGGILTRLSLRPPNQMILPDDKNPTIVWDAEHKRWRDLAGDEEPRAPPPPPPAGPLPQMGVTPQSGAVPNPAGTPPTVPTSNIFKMQKSRHIKKSYVDVFNPSGAPGRAPPPASAVLGPSPAPAPPPARLLVPGPAPHQGEIYDPQQMGEEAYRSGI